MIRLGFDIGGTKILAGLVRYENGRAEIPAKTRIEVKTIGDVFSSLSGAARTLCAKSGVPLNDIACCGVGIPGTVSADGKRIEKVPNIAVLCADFAEKLERTLAMPVTLIQDSRAAAWGEYLCGSGKGAECLLCLTLGTGIGTGIVLNGSLWHGALGTAGELGHLPAKKNGRPCGCGKNGCLEKYCAGGGLDKTSFELLGEGKTARDLFDAAALGNARAQSAIDEAAEMLGDAVAGAINLLSPDVVLFSGGLSEQGGYLASVIARAEAACYSAGRLPRIEKAGLGELAPLIGAALCDLSRRKDV